MIDGTEQVGEATNELRVEVEGDTIEGEVTAVEMIADVAAGLVRLAGHVTKESVRRSLQPGQWSMGVVRPDGPDEDFQFVLRSADGTEEIWWRMTKAEAEALRLQLVGASAIIVPGLQLP